jgi:hypothetical protein
MTAPICALTNQLSLDDLEAVQAHIASRISELQIVPLPWPVMTEFPLPTDRFKAPNAASADLRRKQISEEGFTNTQPSIRPHWADNRKHSPNGSLPRRIDAILLTAPVNGMTKEEIETALTADGGSTISHKDFLDYFREHWRAGLIPKVV